LVGGLVDIRADACPLCVIITPKADKSTNRLNSNSVGSGNPYNFGIFVKIKNCMHRISEAEENYLKAIFKISEKEDRPVSTSAIAAEMNTSAASVTDMIKKLSEKALVLHEKYRGVVLTDAGSGIAKKLIRKHRLWEVFLVNKLDFSWDEVHAIAEQLEHIHSDRLIERLDDFLGFPRFDPHGDPIPDAEGNMVLRKQVLLSELKEGNSCVIVGVPCAPGPSHQRDSTR